MTNKVTRALVVVTLLIPAVCMCAQTDSTKANTLSLDLNYLSHGEIVRGGLPVDGDEETEDKSHFLLRWGTASTCKPGIALRKTSPSRLATP